LAVDVLCLASQRRRVVPLFSRNPVLKAAL
jgi:hypothetical protein